VPARAEAPEGHPPPACIPMAEAAELAESLLKCLECAGLVGHGPGIHLDVSAAWPPAGVPEASGGAAALLVEFGSERGDSDGRGVVAAAARVVKGECPVGSQDCSAAGALGLMAREPLRVLQISAGRPSTLRALCRAVVVPRLALRCARVSAALARARPSEPALPAGAPQGCGSVCEVIEPLADLFAPEEARALLTLEREAALSRVEARWAAV